MDKKTYAREFVESVITQCGAGFSDFVEDEKGMEFDLCCIGHTKQFMTVMERSPYNVGFNGIHIMIRWALGENHILNTRKAEADVELKYHTKHAAEVLMSRPVQDAEEMYDAECNAACIVQDVFVKTRPYPHLLEANGALGSDRIMVYWTEDDEERFIAPKTITSDSGLVLHGEWDKYNVGDTVRYDNAAPGVGHAIFKVTRKDDTGLWGICTEDTRWIPDGGFYR